MITNYFRDAANELLERYLPNLRLESVEMADTIMETLLRAANSEKFILGNNGRLLDDGLIALPEELRLPYPSVVIEYCVDTDNLGLVKNKFGEDATVKVNKRIIFAEEFEEGIMLNCIFKFSGDAGTNPDLKNQKPFWYYPMYTVLIPRNMAAIQPTVFSPEITFTHTAKIYPIKGNKDTDPLRIKALGADFNDEIRVVLEFIEALSCSNVGFSEYETSKKPGAKLKKGALSFDSYRRLMVKVRHDKSKKVEAHEEMSERRSPREHLRRGHVRRLPSGLKIWINNMVINAGVGGRVTKDYVLL